MRETTLTITGVMLLHAAVVILHGRAHLQIPVPSSLEQGLFIIRLRDLCKAVSGAK